MNARLLLLSALTATLCLTASPARGQYIYIDTNGDQVCDLGDILNAGANTVDVWLQTDADKNGVPATCQNGTGQVLDIFSYEIVLHATGTGSVTYGSWTHNSTDLPGYSALRGTLVGGGDFDVFYGKSFNFDPPGLYRLGSVPVTVTGSPTIGINITTSLGTQYSTSFGSSCPGSIGLNTIYLGSDFNDVCGTAGGTPVTTTTWGAIKKTYR